ncbi:heterokaryon incompatibility protein-domain-containing protein [Hypomontagnella monticulosa]|nr:heterokaryon incompatibility protein-domain-containing protein [Hypomontagnella monticulosa]
MAFEGSFTFRFQPPGSVRPTEDESEILCDECAKLDLERSFARAHDLYEGARRHKNGRRLAVYKPYGEGPEYLADFFYVTSLGDRLSRARQPCKLCDFLKQTTPDPSQGTYKLLAICSSESYLFEPPRMRRGRLERRPWSEVDHNVFMTVVREVPGIPKNGVPLRWIETELPKSGPIYRLTPSWSDIDRMTMARELEPKANLSEPMEWLSLCRDFHQGCAPKKPNGVSLPGFRVIDCTKTPPVVESRLWAEKYVALSYVWGPPSGDWPPTILDAVEVTKRMGEKYLWVDRLCIDQSNPQEKQMLISKMDMIYAGAEFTIVAASGDARTGLPGINTTPRQQQPQVSLKERRPIATPSRIANRGTDPNDKTFEMFGVTLDEYRQERVDHGEWLDMYRHGMRENMEIDLEEYKKDKEIMDKYGISNEHLDIFYNLAEDFGQTIDEFMRTPKSISQRMNIPMQEVVPYMKGQMAIRMGLSADEGRDLIIGDTPITNPSKPVKPLPAGKTPGKTILVSALEDVRVTIRRSEWATRGWTYQEGVLSNRRLVFTEKQVYWECRGYAMSEAVNLPLGILVDDTGTRFDDYNLSGIFDGDIHRVPELQYGYRISATDDVAEQVRKLDSHIRTFTSRTLSYDSDSLNAFMGVAACYTGVNDGLALLLGIPVWAGEFANGQPGLQHTFALSISAWTHAAPRRPIETGALIFQANCRRRSQFPSWTWAGWEGRVDFAASWEVSEDSENSTPSDLGHIDFFRALMSNGYVRGIAKRLWSVETILHTIDDNESTLLTGRIPLAGLSTSDPTKQWLLTIRNPLVLRHIHLVHTTHGGEWRRLMGRFVEIHLSVPLTEAQLAGGHKSGEFVTVLVFASIVPFVFNGMARYLILRKADGAGERWERVGRLAMTMEENEMDRYKSTSDMIAAMPVKAFGKDIVLV